MKATTLLIVVSLLFAVDLVRSEGGSDFNARSFFEGEWELEYTRSSTTTENVGAVSFEALKWNVSAPSPQAALLRGISSDSSERVTKMLIEFDEVFQPTEGDGQGVSIVRKGVFYASSQSFLFRNELLDEIENEESENEAADSEELDEDDIEAFESSGSEQQLQKLFAFDFLQYPSNIFFSSGVWGKDGKWLYQITVTNPQAFLLNVIETDAEGKPQTFHFIIGKKQVPPPEKTFFQKYMQFFFLGGLMIYQFLQFKRRQAAQGPEDQAAQPAQVETETTRVRKDAKSEVVTERKKKN